jgi:hypothetical protein
MRHFKLAAAVALAALAILPVAAGAELASQAVATNTTFTVGTSVIVMSAGSSYQRAEVADGSLQLDLGTGDAVILRTLGPNPISLENTAAQSPCKVTRFRENQMIINGPRTLTVTPGTAPCSVANYSTDETPSLTLNQPGQGSQFKAGDVIQLMWTSEGRAVASITLALSLDGGKTYPQVLGENMFNAGYFNWTVGDVNAADARLRLTGNDQGAPVAFAVSPSFKIGMPPATPVVVTPATPPATVAATTPVAAYDPAAQLAAASSVDIGVGYVAPAGALPSGSCLPGLRVKTAINSAVYYCGVDGKRHAFPNSNIHASWFNDFVGVVTVTPASLAGMSLGQPVLYRPGARLIKLTTDPKVYAVAQGGVLRWVETEAAAVRLYGATWNKQIDDVLRGLPSGGEREVEVGCG